ncbi:hypothetical protein ABEB36_007369 [Hypothenemus hampei]|uniref:Ornithine decarboxylase antizyme n=1 Tax=Hypothenemus hampei TaxID=57062 RepID=A0ABD1EXQ5_HYPHA
MFLTSVKIYNLPINIFKSVRSLLPPRPNATTCLWAPGLCGGPDAPGDHRGSPGDSQVAPSSPPPLRLTFRAAPGAGSPPRNPVSSQPWDAVLRGDALYVAPPPHLAEGSREAFVALLEAAEDQLKCKHVVVVFPSDRADRPNLVRTFKFLGFSVLNPTSPLVPSQLAPGNVCMVYNVEE